MNNVETGDFARPDDLVHLRRCHQLHFFFLFWTCSSEAGRRPFGLDGFDKLGVFVLLEFLFVLFEVVVVLFLRLVVGVLGIFLLLDLLIHCCFFPERAKVKSKPRKGQDNYLKIEESDVGHWRESIVANLVASGLGRVAFPLAQVVRMQRVQQVHRAKAAEKEHRMRNVANRRRVLQNRLEFFLYRNYGRHGVWSSRSAVVEV